MDKIELLKSLAVILNGETINHSFIGQRLKDLYVSNKYVRRLEFIDSKIEELICLIINDLD